MKRITPDLISDVAKNEVFVFGSNESGKHGRGAAKQALTWGAKWGQASGLQGRTYGIPTKNHSISRSLTVEEIDDYVVDFIYFAFWNPQLKFLVTEIGCGLAGHSPKDIGPLFKKAVDLPNVWLPKRFLKAIK